jgi:hypothetical protein
VVGDSSNVVFEDEFNKFVDTIVKDNQELLKGKRFNAENTEPAAIGNHAHQSVNQSINRSLYQSIIESIILSLLSIDQPRAMRDEREAARSTGAAAAV